MVQTENIDDKRIRFPRFGTGEQIANVMLLAWEQREMRVDEVEEFTEIVIRIPVRREFKKRLPSLHDSLFERSGSSWTEILKQAYESEVYGGKPLPRYIDAGMRVAYFSAMKALVKNAKGAKDQKYWLDQIETAVGTYEQEARVTPGPQPSISLALEILERYEGVLKKIRFLRSLGRPESGESVAEDRTAELLRRRAIELSCCRHWVRTQSNKIS